jgi:hypothetical protein
VRAFLEGLSPQNDISLAVIESIERSCLIVKDNYSVKRVVVFILPFI